MRRTTILNAKQVKRTSFSEAEQLFTKHCKLKNLSPQTMRYYAEDLKYFHACVPVQYVDEVSQDAFENFIVSELDAGKKITSLNSRIRGLRVFFKFCAEREFLVPALGCGIRLLFIRSPQEIIGAGVVEISQLYQNVCWNVALAHFVVGVADLRTLQIFSQVPLQQVAVLAQIPDASIHFPVLLCESFTEKYRENSLLY